MGGFSRSRRVPYEQTHDAVITSPGSATRFAGAEGAKGSSYHHGHYHGRGMNDILSVDDGNAREQQFAPASAGLQRKSQQTPTAQTDNGHKIESSQVESVKDWDVSKEWDEDSSVAETAKPEAEEAHVRVRGRGRVRAVKQRPWRERRVVGSEGWGQSHDNGGGMRGRHGEARSGTGSSDPNRLSCPASLSPSSHHPTTTSISPLNPLCQTFHPRAKQSFDSHHHPDPNSLGSSPTTDANMMNAEDSVRTAQSTRGTTRIIPFPPLSLRHSHIP